MFGLYTTLALIAAIALISIAAMRYFSRRAHRRTGFPADTWDPFIEGEEPSRDPKEIPRGVEMISGPGVGGRVELPPTLSDRLRGLEAIPSNVAEEERFAEELRRAQEEEGRISREGKEADTRAVEQIGGADGAGEEVPAAAPEAGDRWLPEEGGDGPPPDVIGEEVPEVAAEEDTRPAAARAPEAAPESEPEAAGPEPLRAGEPVEDAPLPGRAPWWVGLPRPADVPPRRTVAQLMGIAMTGAVPSEETLPPFSPAAESPEAGGPVSAEARSSAAAEAPASEGEEEISLMEESADFTFEDLQTLDAEPPPVFPEEAPAGEAEAPVGDGAEEAAAALEGSGAPADTAEEEAPLFLEEEAGMPERADAPGAPAEPPEEAEEPALAAEEEVFAQEADSAEAGEAQEEPVADTITGEFWESLPLEGAAEEEGPREAEEAEDAAILLEEEVSLGPEDMISPEEEPAAFTVSEAEEEGAVPVVEEGVEEEEGKEDIFSLLAQEKGEFEEEEAPLEGPSPYGESAELEMIAEAGGPPSVEGLEAPPPDAESSIWEEEIAEEIPSEAEEGGGRPAREAAEDAAPRAGVEAAGGGLPPAREAAAERAPEAAVEEPPPEGGPMERVSAVLRSHCPRDFVLIEESEAALPSWAGRAAEDARSLLREKEEGRGKPAAEEYLRVGILEFLLGRNEAAAEDLKKALRSAGELGPVLNALGAASFARGKIDPAISYCKEALREGGKEKTFQSVVYRNLGLLYALKGEPSQAAEAIVSAVEAVGREGDEHLLARLHSRAGQLYRKLGAPEKARRHLFESARFYKGTDEAYPRVRTLVALSAVQLDLEQFDAAMRSLEEAAGLCRDGADKAGEALVYGQMGITYAAQDQYTRAISRYGRALELHRELGNRKGEAANLSNIGNIHYFRGDLEEARSTYEEALSINRSLGHLVGQATALGNLGRLHLEAGEKELARERLVEAREIFREAGSPEQMEAVRELLEELDRSEGG